MDDPEWDGFARERSPRVELGEKQPRRTRGPTLAACAALLLLCSMCLRSSWDGSGTQELSAQERQEALTLPPSMVSEEKRRAVVGRDTQEIMERFDRLISVAAEDSPAGRDAKRALERLFEVLRATLGR